jgi:dTDP-4-dehydrorhamnose reductase
MTPTILLTGKNGQVGEELVRVLPRLGKLTAVGRQDLDLLKPEDIRRIIREIRPNLIVNAAAYTAVDQAESDEAAARAVNAGAPAVMAEEAKHIGASLVHYSTDYVFDGSKKSPYKENDQTNPLNVYGKTKLEGEQAIRSSGVPHLIFRTSWVYATRGKNFLLTILRLATRREELRIVQDQAGAPTWSREIAAGTAQILDQLLQKDAGQSFAGKSGTYHMTAAGETTWYDFAKAILEESASQTKNLPWFVAATNGRPLITQRVVPIASAEYPTPARRSLNSILANSRLEKAFGLTLPDWRTQLQSAFAYKR